MELVALPAFADNYIWMIHEGQEALVVDPGQAAPVIDALDRRGLQLTGILVTHHHADHVGGLEALLPRLGGPVFGPAGEALPVHFEPLRQGDRAIWRGHQFEVIDVPGHTAGHIAYWSTDVGDAPVLFCGDTLFSAGCGRLFEGTPAQMSASLGRLAALPGTTRVCCAHEYTLSNLRFAAAVEPGNADIAAHRARCEAWRAEGRPTLPSTLDQESRINPFLRCDQPAVVAAARAQGAAGDDPVSVLAALRQWKNEFR
ncbi:hydroxyacylglutathione hydrolase [Eleftheria terrae]|uniref:hydroxyacylglutathione hydrolase n=1 Tax=Eleftheria terrae TaxID=1597781 RepID=UPI00263AD6C8|nr:hydroxyacylglutathione hydrolase [Eleftheria terrae]WKB55075.1 hydroxyacylglutathione hydrolase [Eleftheria terrae]